MRNAHKKINKPYKIYINKPTTIYVFSDIHITTDLEFDSDFVIKKLINKLKEIEAFANDKEIKLVFLGDFLDLARNDIKLEALYKRPYIDLFNQIKKLAEKKVEIFYILGNHDRLLLSKKEIVLFLKKKGIKINKENPFSALILYRKDSIALEHGNQYDPLSQYNNMSEAYEMTFSDQIVNFLKRVKKNEDQKGTNWIKDADKVRPINNLSSWFLSHFFYQESSKSFKILLFPTVLNYFITRLLPLLFVYYLIFRKKIKISEIPQEVIIFIIILISIDVTLLFLYVLYLILKKDIVKVMKKFNLFQFSPKNRNNIFEKNVKKDLMKNRTSFINHIDNLRVIILGHTHIPDLKKIKNKYVVINGCWMKGFESLKSWIALPRVFFEKYRLNYVVIDLNNTINIKIKEICINSKPNLTLLEKIAIIQKLKYLNKITKYSKEKVIYEINLKD